MEGENFTAIAESRLPPGFTRDKRTRLGNAKRFVKPSSSKLSPKDEEGGRGKVQRKKEEEEKGKKRKEKGQRKTNRKSVVSALLLLDPECQRICGG